MKEKLYKKRGYANFIARAFINYVFGPLKISHAIFRFFDRHVSSTELFDGYFLKYNPDLVFATDIFSPTDANLLLSAKRHNIKSVGMVRSWDCTTNKNLLRVIPTQIVTNNVLIKEELVRFHDVERSIITSVGFSQFDPYVNMKPDSREVFFEKIGADLKKRLILFAPAGSALSDVDAQYCDILSKALQAGRIPKNVQFLVRKHPQDATDLSQFEHNENFIIEQPGISFKNNSKATEIDEIATRHLINSITYSDLVISINTSLGLDAVVFDKPHIMIGFDGYEDRPLIKSVRDYHQEDNMKDFIRTGAAHVAQSPAELIEWINKYLDDPSMDASGREKARQTILYKIDGKTGERIADFILKNLF